MIPKLSSSFWIHKCIQTFDYKVDLCRVKNPLDIRAFGTHLRRLREEREMSQQQLADIADVAKITVQRIENAKFTVTLDVMVSLARALKISMPELVAYKTRKNKI